MYKPISCVQTGMQDGYQRFPDPSQPLIKHWRCDLTALSHVYNLYFVACNDEIYVYSPSFPSQDLNDPVRILTVPSSGLSTPPGIDISDPHSVTRICVEYLGNTEVLLITCDDGDVVGWRVGEIHRAIISQRDSADSEDDVDAAGEIRCFEHHNVGCSAWGLAVHRTARLIAISANTHLVRVVAYGLSQPDDSVDGQNDFPFPRHQNRFITLRAQTNIPAVSFDNTGGDPTGRWLSSSSIDGLTHLWDLSRPSQPARVIAVGHCASVSSTPDLRVLLGYTIEGPAIPESCKCLNRNSVPHAAWAAIFIDPWSCHRVDSLVDACGVEVKHRKDISSRSPSFWDITEEKTRFATRRRTTVPGIWHFGSWAQEEIPLVSTVAAEGAEDDDEDATSEGSDQTSMEVDSDDALIHTVTDAMLEAVTHATAETHPGPSTEGEEPGIDLSAVPTQPSGISLPLPLPPPELAPLPQVTAPPVPPPNEETQSDEDDTSTSDDNDMAELQFDQSKKPYCASLTSNYHKEQSAELPTHHPRPMIVVTKEEIYLFQRPLDTTTPPSLPILTMRNPLYPPHSYHHLPGSFTSPVSIYHRQCYTAQIPELGVFIVGSPAGRVGIFRLTRTPYQTEHATELFGFRLDHLLPLCISDEENVVDDEWGRQLVGIAVGPVQGIFDAGEDEEREGRGAALRRWRLLLYYHDHTVYAYELGKYSEEGELQLDELVV